MTMAGSDGCATREATGTLPKKDRVGVDWWGGLTTVVVDDLLQAPAEMIAKGIRQQTEDENREPVRY